MASSGKRGDAITLSMALAIAAVLSRSPLSAAEPAAPPAPPPAPAMEPSSAETWCVVPGEIRQLGPDVAYVARPPAVRMSAEDCARRGGEAVQAPPPPAQPR